MSYQYNREIYHVQGQHDLNWVVSPQIKTIIYVGRNISVIRDVIVIKPTFKHTIEMEVPKSRCKEIKTKPTLIPHIQVIKASLIHRQ